MKKLTYKNAEMFIHCGRCLKDFMAGKFGKGKSASEVMSYELASASVTDIGGLVSRVFVAYCKRCHRQVWDSQHLEPKKEIPTA